MDRTFEAGASGTPPSAPASPSTGYATAGNPATSTPATKPGKYWYHMVTEELRKVIVDAGLTPDHTNVNQLSQAIQQLIINGAVKTPVRAATTANIASLAGGAPSTLDGVTLAANDRVLVKDQTTASQNGIYVVTTLGTGANGSWTRSGDADGAGEIFSGMLVVVQEGSAYADSVWELQTDGAITVGTTSLTFARKDSSSAATVQGAFKNLQISAGGTAASISVSYDELVLGDGSGLYVTERSISGTITTTNTGAGGLDTGALAASTWYSIWRIGKADGTRAWLFSLSATAPTMPAGYTLRARIGWFRTDGTGNKYPLSFKQVGRRTHYVVAAGSNVTAMPQMASGSSGSLTTPTWTAVAVGNFVPTTAAAIHISLFGTSDSGLGSQAAPNNSYGAASVGSTAQVNPPPLVASTSDTGGLSRSMICGTFVLESSNIYYASGRGSSAIHCMGWDDNL